MYLQYNPFELLRNRNTHTHTPKNYVTLKQNKKQGGVNSDDSEEARRVKKRRVKIKC